MQSLHFAVSDTGIGMTKEQVGRLFSAFEQADESITKRFGGTGLGLAISKNIVEKMGGRIYVTSAAGEGSSFQFDVSLVRDHKDEPQVVWGSIRPSDLSVLIVDADELVREQFVAIVDKFAIRTDSAATASEALALVDAAHRARRQYDVVFLDYQLPDQGVIDLVLDIGQRVDKNTAIIMTTFVEWSRIEMRANAVGVYRYIAKPLFPSTVLNAINEVVGKAARGVTMGSQPQSGQDFSEVRLLLAEDIEINREIFMALLEDTGIQIDTAENGRIAVDKFAAGPGNYDMIVMDIQMPEMDGYEATRAIRSLPVERAATVPIIAMTANAFKEDVDRCLEAGMNSHLAKPIDVKALMGAIQAYGVKS